MKFWQVDAFTNQPFKGNPAGVLIYDKPMPDDLMQQIAAEINLSETSFVLIRPDQEPLLRWFTPTMEIDLCGHGTLSAAHILFFEKYKTIAKIVFETKFAGQLGVAQNNGTYTITRISFKYAVSWI